MIDGHVKLKNKAHVLARRRTVRTDRAERPALSRGTAGAASTSHVAMDVVLSKSSFPSDGAAVGGDRDKAAVFLSCAGTSLCGARAEGGVLSSVARQLADWPVPAWARENDPPPEEEEAPAS